jgi:hypothetical protein
VRCFSTIDPSNLIITDRYYSDISLNLIIVDKPQPLETFTIEDDLYKVEKSGEL